MSLMGKSKSLLVIGIAFMVAQCTAPSVAGICTTLCYAGEYCKGFNCLPCEYGFYMSIKAHHKVSCEAWTKKSGAGWIVSKDGNQSTDREWQCDHGYEETNNSGITECRKIAIPSTPASVDSTSNAEKGNITDSTVSDHMDTHNDNLLIVYIIVPFAIVGLIVGGLLIFCYLKKRKLLCFSSNQQVIIKYKPKKGSKKPKKNNSNKSKDETESENFLESGDAGNNDNGSDLPSKSPDDSKKQNKNDDDASGHTVIQNSDPPINPASPDNAKGFDLPSISSDDPKKRNKNGDGAGGDTVLHLEDPSIVPSGHGEAIPDTLPGDNVTTLDNLHLLDALDQMFGTLCEKLGVIDGNKVMDKLQLKLVDTGRGYKQNFTKCLLKWISSPADGNDKVLRLLGRLKNLLEQLDRNDIVHDFDKITEDVTRIIRHEN